ncbi:phage tail assembly chaperone [Pseudomonas sp.]|uniref:phage tail assembly chaperone n=1 Tax=Pseudomonas sp. TaxID=306 RepID=UPI003F2E7808
MKIYWSSSARSFFDSRINTVLPQDAVEISSEHRDQLLAGEQRNCRIGADVDGRPMLEECPDRVSEFAAAVERTWRDARLLETDAIVARHRDQLEAGIETTLSKSRYETLQAYRFDLRNWPTSRGFPAIAKRPVLIDEEQLGPVRKKRVRKPVQSQAPTSI